MEHHELKCFTKQFEHIVSGSKRAMVRFNDRGYGVGHTFTLNEGELDLNGFRYTGRKVSGVISHLDDFGCDYGYVVLSLSKVGMLVVEEEDSDLVKFFTNTLREKL